MSRFTISIILIFGFIIANSVYIINIDIHSNKEKAIQIERALDFKISPKHIEKRTKLQKTKYTEAYYFTEYNMG